MPVLFPAGSRRVAVPQPSRRRSSLRVAPRCSAVVAVLATGACLTGAAPAAGDVLTAGLFDGSSPLTPRLLSPDGRDRRLASVEYGVSPEGAQRVGARFSPDGTLVAVAAGSGVVLVPTDGRSALRLRGVDATTGTRTSVNPLLRTPDGAKRLYGSQVEPVVAWSADGRRFASGPVPDGRGRQVVRRCEVATLVCRVTPVGASAPVSSLGDGRLVLGPVPSRSLARTMEALSAFELEWAPRSAAWVRRKRRLLSRPRFDGVRIEAGAGLPAVTVSGGRAPASRQITTVHEIAPGGTTSGAVLEVRTQRLRLRTRRRAGRLEATVERAGGGRVSYLSVTPDGRARSLPLLVEDSEPVVALPDGGWFGTALRHNVWMIPARIDAAGRATTMRLGGREITPARLHDALGLPRERRPPARGVEDDGSWLQIVEAIGVEAETNSAIVGYDDGDERFVVARLPFDGGRPTVVAERQHDGAYSYRSH